MKVLQVAVGVVKNAQGQVLISLRDKSLHQGGLWEFPGGKIEQGESAKQALIRELKEELAITVITATPLITIKHQYPDLTVQLNVFLVDHFSGNATSCEGQAFKWVNPNDLENHAFPAANQAIITAAKLPAYYAILDDLDESLLLINLQKILTRGIKLIQLRLKTVSPQTLHTFLEQAYPLCRQQGVLLLINSAVNNAANFAVDGIHLTSQNLISATKRPTFPIDTSKQARWVAASCHSLQDLQHAQTIGVDFVVLAPVLATKTHPETVPLGWEQFETLVSQVNIPVYALGGLSESDLDKARQTGAQGVSAIRAFLEG
ncbi:Nudix family hydrolase [Methylobacter sp. S3L5C]|uniref:Nudix family hydrolase n=1 Tax=Methylobacter sp. S3L5C TaxID=2839024 RepID=UPI001FAD86AE|nr:Nudix family hydrolase [Methylobacter sp. S3L5C]UOA08735.1 Nudix family hydrolase [Methylobacter sp. S3L5C]